MTYILPDIIICFIFIFSCFSVGLALKLLLFLEYSVKGRCPKEKKEHNKFTFFQFLKEISIIFNTQPADKDTSVSSLTATDILRFVPPDGKQKQATVLAGKNHYDSFIIKIKFGTHCLYLRYENQVRSRFDFDRLNPTDCFPLGHFSWQNIHKLHVTAKSKSR